MKHDWIIDVLTDLREYALSNYCMALAEQLDDAIMVAAAETGASAEGRVRTMGVGDRGGKRPALTSI